MQIRVLEINCLFLGVLIASLSCVAADSGIHAVAPQRATEAEKPPQVEQTLLDLKQPVSWFKWGTDFRVRWEHFDNYLTLSPNNTLHEQDFLRFRARLWASLQPVDDLSLNARVATEPREWLRPAGFTPYKGKSGLDMTEGIIDNLNVQWRNMFGTPAAITVGRQDILWGDGWLLGDGTPSDGSWTYFVEAARFTYEFKEQHTTFEGIGIIQNAEDDSWLPTINDQDRYLTEQNEKGAILSVANASLKEANVTGYFVYKEDTMTSGFDAVHKPPPRGADNANIYTVGGRVNGSVVEHLKYWVEGAYQFGRKQDATDAYPSHTSEYRTLDAFGVNAKLGYLFKDRLNNQVQLAYEYLSGDNPNTAKDEMFDVLWGRWPYWGDVGLYSFAAETRVGQQANLQRIGPIWSLSPMKDMDLSAAYMALFAPEEIPTRAASVELFTHKGNFRGHFLQGVLKYKFSKHVSGHFWAECVFPGDYYTSKTTWYFLRSEVLFTF